MKPQRACTHQIEEYRHQRLQIEYAQFSADDRRRVAFRNCGQCPMQFVYGWPDYDCAVSNHDWEIGTAHVLGLPVPSLPPYLGMVIGTSSLGVDAHGDAAAVEEDGGPPSHAGTTGMDVLDLEGLLIGLFAEADRDGSGSLDRHELEALGWWTRGGVGDPCALGDF
mgnify:CR=1 FL=1